MSGQTELVVHGRCACGRRYRVRNAQEGAVVTCPACGRAITITRADLAGAKAGETLIPVQPEQTELREALPLGDVELWPAPPGSRPGLTGQRVFPHEEALLNIATCPQTLAEAQAAAGATVGRMGSTASFARDLLAGFALAGSGQNAAAVFVTAAVLWFGYLVAGYPPVLLGLLVEVGLTAYLVAFFWQVMLTAANGEDELPLSWTDFSWWDDAVRPLVWTILLAVLLLPACIVIAGRQELYTPWLWWLAPACSYLWPMAVLSVAVGRSLAFLRPDWLLRSIGQCGSAYVLVWLVVLGSLAHQEALELLRPLTSKVGFVEQWVMPVAAWFLKVYLGFAVFRGIGLLYRHFGRRFPWGI